MLPLVHRELLSEARRLSNYWFRVFTAGAVTVASAFIILHPGIAVTSMGQVLFTVLKYFLLVLIWLLVPLVVADSISSERREGTLGLLFLTPLSAAGVVLGKMLSQSLRLATMFLAMLPVLAFPFLLGGVSSSQALDTAALLGSSFLLALCCGTLISAYSQHAIRALVGAAAVGVFGAVAFVELGAVLVSCVEWNCLASRSAGARARAWLPPTIGAFLDNKLQADHNGLLYQIGRAAAISGGEHLQAEVLPLLTPPERAGLYQSRGLVLSFMAAAGCLICLAAAAWEVRRSWRAQTLTKGQEWALRKFCTPVLWKGTLHKQQSALLDGNPIRWLQGYSWSARLTKWGWCLGIIIAEIMLVGDQSLGILVVGQYWLSILTLAALLFSAVSSFRTERESGALELLLVSPITANQVIWGRVRGIWRQFFPAVALLALVWIYQEITLAAFRYSSGFMAAILWLGSLLACFTWLPAVGLACSTWRSGAVVSWLGALGIGLGLPWAVYLLSSTIVFRVRYDSFTGTNSDLWAAQAEGRMVGSALFLLVLIAFARGGLHLLRRELDSRRFALQRIR